MSSKAEYNRRKQQGICVICGKEKAWKGGSTCEECRTKKRIQQRETREFYRKIGICPRCGKNKLFGDEKTCPECLAENMVIMKKSRKKLGKTDMDYFQNHQKQLKQHGLCRTGCGRKRAPGHTYCEICLVKHREASRQKRRKDGLERSERPSYGLCYTCGQPLDREGRQCIKCAEKATKNLPKTRGNKHWRCDNKLVFKSY